MSNLDIAIQYAEDIITGKTPACLYTKQACYRFASDLENPNYYYNPQAVDIVISFINQLYLTETRKKKHFYLEPWQTFIIANLYGIYNKESNTRKYKYCYIELARKNGKAVSLLTPIPTPDGWKLMRDINIGDNVFDEDGNTCEVIDVSEVQNNNDCYKITFEDGEEIIADANHQWSVITKQSRRCWNFTRTTRELHKYKDFRDGGYHIKTTAEMLNDYYYVRLDGKGIDYKYRVPNNKPIELPDKKLLIDPYLLGCWLGDGDKSNPTFTVSTTDLPMYNFVTGTTEGSFSYSYRTNKDNTAIRVNLRIPKNRKLEKEKYKSNLHNELKELNLLYNKHIPKEYLRASKQQRLELLRGLMDTDGSVSKAGQCEFIQKSKIITDGISELLSSLGLKHTISEKNVKINGKDCGIVYRVLFWTTKSFSCFKLERKHNRLKDNLNDRMLNKSIINIEKIENVPVKCISVNSPNNLYLIGNRFTTTHNSMVATALALYHLIFDDDAQVVVSANSREQAKNVDFKKVKQFAAMIDTKQKHLIHYYNSIKYGTNELIVTASDASKLDGLNLSCAVIDELHEAPDNKLYNVIKSSMGAREEPMFIVITTAGFNRESFCYQLRTYCTEILSKLKTDETQFALIYTIEDNDDYTDKNTWIKANPNINISLKSDFLDSEVNKAVNNEAERNGVLVKNFNVWTKNNTLDEWIPEKYIMASMSGITMDDERFKEVDCWCGVDLGSVSDLTCVSYLIQLDDKIYFFNQLYIPEDSLNTHLNREMFKEAAELGYLNITPGNVCDYDRILSDILSVNNKHYINQISYDKWNSTQFAISATEAGLFLEPYSQMPGNLNKPIKELQRLLLSDNVIIERNTIIKWMFGNVVLKVNNMGNVSIDKSSRSKKIDGVASMINAFGGYLDSPRYSFNIY